MVDIKKIENLMIYMFLILIKQNSVHDDENSNKFDHFYDCYGFSMLSILCH
jgi:hypothetical protein